MNGDRQAILLRYVRCRRGWRSAALYWLSRPLFEENGDTCSYVVLGTDSSGAFVRLAEPGGSYELEPVDVAVLGIGDAPQDEQGMLSALGYRVVDTGEVTA